MAIVGEALQKAREMIEEAVKKSYEVVPERVDTPMVAPQTMPTQDTMAEPRKVTPEPTVNSTPEPPKPIPFG
jgi:ribosomal protein L23